LLSPDFVKLAEAYGIPAVAVTKRSEVLPAIRMARSQSGAALIDFRVEQEDSVYPMVPAGADLDAMIRRPTPLVERPNDE
jgi:acetolactate synthase-1/2/3 large subunit